MTYQYIENKIEELEKRIEALEQDMPSVTSAKKVGVWIIERTYMKCPNCYDIWHYEENQTERFRYCPTCGRKMEAERESEDKE